MANDTYQPVPHDAAFREQLLSNPAVKADYDANITTYAMLDEILSARREAGLTQAQVAERMGTKASAVARLGSALVSVGSGITHRDVGNADIAGANICPCQNDGIPQTWVYDVRSLSWESVNECRV